MKHDLPWLQYGLLLAVGKAKFLVLGPTTVMPRRERIA